MIAEEDYSNLWRVPMSLGEPRKEKDKSGGECWAAEVAINANWFEQMAASQVANTVTVFFPPHLFRFFLGLSSQLLWRGWGTNMGKMQGDSRLDLLHMTSEHGRLDRDSWVVLKNKKSMGDALPAHRIQQRATAGIQANSNIQHLELLDTLWLLLCLPF